MFNKCLLVLFFLSFYSCSQKQQHSVDIQIKQEFSFSNDYKGGVLLVGERLDHSEFFTTALNSETFNIQLSNGKWKLGVIAWEGKTFEQIDGETIDLGKFSGEHLCGYTLADLKGNNSSIVLNISKEKCDDSFFEESPVFADPEAMDEKYVYDEDDDSYEYYNQFKMIAYNPCSGPWGERNSPIEICPSWGASKSFKIIIPGQHQLKNNSGISINSISSNCIPEFDEWGHEYVEEDMLNTIYIDFFNTHLNLPLKSVGFPTKFIIESFIDNNCQNSSYKKTIVSQGSFITPDLNFWIDSGLNFNYIFARHSTDFDHFALLPPESLSPSETFNNNWGACNNFSLQIQNADDEAVPSPDANYPVYVNLETATDGGALIYHGHDCTDTIAPGLMLESILNADGSALFSVRNFRQNTLIHFDGSTNPFEFSAVGNPLISLGQIDNIDVEIVKWLISSYSVVNTLTNKLLLLQNSSKFTKVEIIGFTAGMATLSYYDLTDSGANTWTSGPSITLAINSCHDFGSSSVGEFCIFDDGDGGYQFWVQPQDESQPYGIFIFN